MVRGNAVAERERRRAGSVVRRGRGAKEVGEGHGEPDAGARVDLNGLHAPHVGQRAADWAGTSFPANDDSVVVVVLRPEKTAGRVVVR